MDATLNLPEGEVREMVRAALVQIVADEARWLSRERAAARICVDPSTFNRLARIFGLPKSKLNAKVVRFWSADVDAMMRAHLQRQAGRNLIEFPSLLPSEPTEVANLG
jgi:hypothetical protein